MIMQAVSKTSAYEAELLASLTKFYQTFDRVMSDYAKLYDIIDLIREDYDNSKFLNLYQQYKELQRIVKSSLRKWYQLETKASTSSSTMANKDSPSSNSLSSSVSSNSLRPSDAFHRSRHVPRVPSANSFVFHGGDTFTHNISARLTAQKDMTTRDLYEECTRLERDIFQYKTKSSEIEDILGEIADMYREFNKSQRNVIQLAKGYKQLKSVVKKVVHSDI